MSDGIIAVAIISGLLLVALILYGIAFLLFLKVKGSKTFLPVALFPCVDVANDAANGVAQMKAEKQGADDAVIVAQAAVAAAETSGDADALAAGQQALAEAETKAHEAARTLDVAVAKCATNEQRKSVAIGVHDQPMIVVQDQPMTLVQSNTPRMGRSSATNPKIEALKKQLIAHDTEQKNHIIRKEFGKAGELEEKMEAMKVEIQNEIQNEIKSRTKLKTDLKIEALKKQLIEHITEQKKHIIRKEFGKAGELEEKMEAVKVEIQRLGGSIVSQCDNQFMVESPLTTDDIRLDARDKELVVMDLNNDGLLLDVDEFIAAGGTKEDFSELDLDRDGLLDERELTVLARLDDWFNSPTRGQLLGDRGMSLAGEQM